MPSHRVPPKRNSFARTTRRGVPVKLATSRQFPWGVLPSHRRLPMPSPSYFPRNLPSSRAKPCSSMEAPRSARPRFDPHFTRALASSWRVAPEVTRRYTRANFIQPIKQRLVVEVGNGLGLEGASAAALVKQMQSQSKYVLNEGRRLSRPKESQRDRGLCLLDSQQCPSPNRTRGARARLRAEARQRQKSGTKISRFFGAESER